MASTVAMLTGLSGLNTHARGLDVIGDNIANVNTTGFKQSRALFSTMISRNFHEGREPQESSGGVNPYQVGFGVKVGGVQKDFRDGGLTVTGDGRDLAIEGRGLFIVRQGEQEFYTRVGAFRLDEDSNLVTASGERVQGFGIDDDFNVVEGALTGLNLPVGTATLARATEFARFTGNLNAAGDVAASGSVHVLGATETAGFSVVPDANPAPDAGNMLETTSRLLDIADPDDPDGTTPLFGDGQRLQIEGASRGTKLMPAAELLIGAATTVADLMTFLSQSLGIRTDLAPNPDGGEPGVSLDPATGRLTLTGNTGLDNDIDLDEADVRLLSPDGAVIGQPLAVDKSDNADGESVRTTFLSFDSLGNRVEVDVTMVLEDRGGEGTTWRYFVDSRDDSTDLALATGTLGFDQFGRLTTTTVPTVSIDRTGQGAATPLEFELRFEDEGDRVTALADVTSRIVSSFQDGAPLGTLSTFAVEQDGLIRGAFTNGLERPLGQIVLARFANDEGLVSEGDSLYRPSGNSGEVQITMPTELGAGRIVAGALEQSNVDLGQEFINLILTSTGYSASSRVIRTADDMMQQLMALVR